MKILAIYGGYVLLTHLLYYGVFWSDDNAATYYGIRLLALLLSIVIVLRGKRFHTYLTKVTKL